MADTKLTDLQSLTSVADTDLLYVVSLQDVPSGESKKINVSDFLGNLDSDIATSGVISTISLASNYIAGVNVTGTNINGTNYTGNFVNVTSVNANTGTFTNIFSDFSPANVTSNITATYVNDNSKIYNFNTSASNLSVILPSTLPNGFNIGITNIGTGTVYISSTQTPMLCAFSNKCSTQFGSFFIYKASNTFYAVGGLDI